MYGDLQDEEDMRTPKLKVISEMCVARYHDLAKAAPKKCILYLCQIQTPLAETLQEEWRIGI